MMLKQWLPAFLFVCLSPIAIAQPAIAQKSNTAIVSTFIPIPDSLQSFVDAAVHKCNNKLDSVKANCILDEGYTYNSLHYMKAVCLGEKGYLIAQQINNKTLMGKALMLLGYAHFWKSNYDQALSYYLSALTIYQQQKDKKSEAYALKDIGILYDKNGRRKDAKGYYIASMNIFKKLNDEVGIADLDAEIGTSYEYDNDAKEALKYYYQSYFLNKKLNSDMGSSYSSDYIAAVYSGWGQYDSALYYEKISLDLRIKLKDEHTISIGLNNMGEIYFAKKDFKIALDYFKRSTVLSKKSGFVDLEQYSYDYIAKCYGELGDYKNAFEFQNLHNRIKDSIFNTSRSKQLIELQTKYETEKKDNQIKTLQSQTEINNLLIKEQNLNVEKRNYLLIALALLLLMLITGTYFWINKQKLKNQLAKEKAIKETEENERLRIAKDIHDDLGSGLSKINFLSEIIYSKSELLPEIRHSSESVKETAKKMIENMRDLIWALNPDNTTLPNLVARMREYTTDYLEDFPIELTYSFPDTIPNRPINKEYHRELFMIVKESLNNISKHSKATKVLFGISITNSHFSYTIRDNGIGFSEKTVKKGNGLRNMNSRINALGGEFEVSSQPNEFTVINVTVPLQKIIET